MTSFLPRVFFCDLDGTLLEEDGSLHPDVRKGFLALSERGTRVVLASARMPVAIAETCDAPGLAGPEITLNGAPL